MSARGRQSIVISCGGTGGHLAPGIALAEGLLARAAKNAAKDTAKDTAPSPALAPRVTLLISQKAIDARLAAKYPQLHFVAVPGLGFSWAPLRLARCLASQARGLAFCLKLLLREHPRVVVGMGGFTSAGVALAARLLGVPLDLHESNRVPGLATRLLGRLATRVYLPEGVRLPSVRLPRIRHAGFPVRREIAPQPRSAACAALGLDARRPVLVIFGGSQGAGPLNDWAQTHLEELAAEGVQVYCVTGPGKGEPRVCELPVTRRLPTTPTTAPAPSTAAPAAPAASADLSARLASEAPPEAALETLRAVFVPFCDEVATLLSAATLVVSRAGAGTLAELIRCTAPAILIPYPHAADDHQRANATFFEKQGGGIVIEQSEMGRLHREVLDTVFNDWLLHRLRSNLAHMERAPALDFILDDLETLARE